jgi:hypothetical protein
MLAAPLGGAWKLSYHAAVMRFRRVTLLVAVYVALDFGNPMMPGAFQLVGGSLETVAGCQPRSAEDPVPAITALPRHLSTIAPPREPTRPAGRVVATLPPTPTSFRTAFEPHSAPPSSSDDD